MDARRQSTAIRRVASTAFLMVVSASLVVALPPARAEAQSLPPLAFTATPTVIDAGSSFVVEGEGCPSEMPPGYRSSQGDISVHVKPDVDGPNFVSWIFEGREGDADAVSFTTAVGVSGEQALTVESGENGRFSFRVDIPWWDPGGDRWVIELACWTLGPVGPWEPSQPPYALAASLQAPLFTVIESGRPSFDRLQVVDLEEWFGSEPLPLPSAPAMLVTHPGALVDLSGRGCRPPQSDDIPGTGQVAITLALGDHTGTRPLQFPVVEGALVIDRALYVPADRWDVIATMRVDGSWTASTRLPASAPEGPLYVEATCLSDLAAEDLVFDAYKATSYPPGGFFVASTAHAWVPVVFGAPAAAVVVSPELTG
jgi:hypothetical protein